jgi:photosystem II stability/assembly factor-like uncharacterized protein
LKGSRALVGVGTQTGGYLLVSDSSRKNWRRVGPFLKGESVNSISFDPKGNRLYAASLTEGVFTSKDLGRTWKPSSKGLNVRKVWTVEVDPKKPSSVYAGTHYGHLFHSKDGGENWSEVVGLHNAPRRNEWGIDWAMGTTGLCLHTVRIDPSDTNRIYVVASGNGTYRSDDGGETWKWLQEGVMGFCPIGGGEGAPDSPKNARAEDMEKHLKQVHVCTHKLALSGENPSTLYQQNHCGVFLSNDGGESWEDRSPAPLVRHGFAISLVEDGAQTLYTIPAYQGKCKKHNSCVQGELAVYRTSDRGRNWEKLTKGLPKNVHTCVLRDGMATDGMDPPGLYFGTTTGEVYQGKDGGDSWAPMLKGVGRVQGVSAFRL